MFWLHDRKGNSHGKGNDSLLNKKSQHYIYKLAVRMGTKHGHDISPLMEAKVGVIRNEEWQWTARAWFELHISQIKQNNHKVKLLRSHFFFYKTLVIG